MHIPDEQFESFVDEGIAAIPDAYRSKIANLAFLVESEPSEAVREEYELGEDESLLGLYTGVPVTERGSEYGVGPTLPDTIIIYKKPTEEMAAGSVKKAREIVIDTVWHEVGHYLGLDEEEVERRERERGIGHARPE